MRATHLRTKESFSIVFYQKLISYRVVMARTKASVGAKVSSGKSNKARCSVAPPTNNSSGGSDHSSRSSGGGNPVCPRETPKWQRPINTFFVTKPSQKVENMEEESAGTSNPKPKPRRNVIESDDEEEEKPKNKELDETIELEPLTGENSHKLEEFYTKNSDKGKGVGKKSKKKEIEKEIVNLNIVEDSDSDKDIVNNNTEKSKKRERDDSFEESVTKKVKV